MIDSMNSSMSMPPPPKTGSSSNQTLTEEQHSLISDTLSEYDVDNLTEADALSIVEAFAQAGIEPSMALEKAVSSAGFNSNTIGELAQVEDAGSRPPPPPPKQSSEEISSLVDYLAEIMEEKLAASDSNELSDQDKQSIIADIYENFNIGEDDSIINTTA